MRLGNTDKSALSEHANQMGHNIKYDGSKEGGWNQFVLHGIAKCYLIETMEGFYQTVICHY